MTLRTVFSGSITVSMSSRPSPSVSVTLALDAMGIAHDAAEHLVAAADAHDMAAAPAMGGEVAVPAVAAEVDEVGDGRFRAGNDDQPGILRQRPARRDEDDLDLRLGLQRIEIVEIGDARQHRHGDLQRAGFARRQGAPAPPNPPTAAVLRHAATARCRSSASR